MIQTNHNKIDESKYLKNIEHNKIVFINGNLEEIDFKHEDSKKFKFLKENKIEKNNFEDNSLINLNNAFTINNYKIDIEKEL